MPERIAAPRTFARSALSAVNRARTLMPGFALVAAATTILGAVPAAAAFAQAAAAARTDVATPRAPATWTVPRNSYFPPRAEWAQRRPSQVGLDSTKLAAAIAFAIENESTAPRDLEQAHYQSFGREPFGDPVGPFKTRGEPTGIVVRGGYVVTTWGDPDRVDMTFSVTKSFVSSMVGVAVDRGLIRSVNDRVAQYVGPILPYAPGLQGMGADRPMNGRLLDPFTGPHNSRITWDHLLRQTSDWEGTLWGKPEWADRPDRDASTWLTRERREPGSTYEYNDTRVNVLALAATSVWRRPLPEVLRETVMDPIGASSTWRWMGYDNAWIVLDGHLIQAVGGGGHWGGGMFINAWDQARFGLLTLRRGVWQGEQILSEAWVQQALTPTPAQPTYGYMNWFLNTDGQYLKSATPNTFAHVGNGTNIVINIPEHDLVIVARWIANNAVDGLVERVLASVTGPVPAGIASSNSR